MYGDRTSNVIQLQHYPNGVAQGLRTSLCDGRSEIITVGPNPEFAFIGSDPYNTNAGTGLIVPAVASGAIGGARYLFLLARASFGAGEVGKRLVGIRQYAELIARIPGREPPLSDAAGPPAGSTVVFRREIKSPLWHPPDGDISWHVMVTPQVQRDLRNPANTDGVIYQNALSPALLYQSLAPYVPPHGGRPWGYPLAASLGNMHDLRYRWRTERSEVVLDVPLPVPCDIALYASVRQNDPALNPVLAADTAQQFSALEPEDQFLVAFPTFAQYGAIAGALVFDSNLGENVP